MDKHKYIDVIYFAFPLVHFSESTKMTVKGMGDVSFNQ
jgi:hypothetical protein